MGPAIRVRASGAETAKSITKRLLTQVAPELLAEQRLDVGLVVDHKNQNAHVLPRSLPDKLLFLGRTM